MDAYTHTILTGQYFKGLINESDDTEIVEQNAATDLSSVGVDAVDDGLDFLFEYTVCRRICNHQGSLCVLKCMGVCQRR